MEKPRSQPELRANLIDAGRSAELRISLPERFVFESHRDFRSAYESSRGLERVYIVDFAANHSIDSSGLGMLLQLIEHAHGDRQRIHFVNCSANIRAMLTVAGFDELATLT